MSTTQLLYDGSELIGEYEAASGALKARYVPRIAAWDAGGTKSWYHMDAQGSMIATSDASGIAATINQYGP